MRTCLLGPWAAKPLGLAPITEHSYVLTGHSGPDMSYIVATRWPISRYQLWGFPPTATRSSLSILLKHIKRRI